MDVGESDDADAESNENHKLQNLIVLSRTSAVAGAEASPLPSDISIAHIQLLTHR
jgi:hypothetical protein